MKEFFFLRAEQYLYCCSLRSCCETLAELL